MSTLCPLEERGTCALIAPKDNQIRKYKPRQKRRRGPPNSAAELDFGVSLSEFLRLEG